MINPLNEEFYKIVASSRDLIRLNFREIVISNDERIKQTIFESALFRLYVSLDVIRGEISIVWKKLGHIKLFQIQLKEYFSFLITQREFFMKLKIIL